jgi:hypothetical protein
VNQDLLATHIRAALAGWNRHSLLSPETIDKICRSQAACMPAEMTSRFGFECRLGEQEPDCDFLVRTGAQPEEWPAFARYAAGQSSSPWAEISALLDARIRPALKNLWLEYDFAAANNASLPSVFFGTDALISGAEIEDAARGIGILRGRSLPPQAKRTLQGIVAALPKKTKLFQAGLMCSRAESPLRVCLLGPEFIPNSASENHSLRDFLAAIHWPADPSPVAERLQAFAPLLDHVALDLDIRDDGSLIPRLGLEIYQNPATTPVHRIAALVSQLTSLNLCTAEKADGLLAWNGLSHERLHPDLWPKSLVAARTLRGGGQYSTFCRWLHHIKLVYEPRQPLTAKSYLAVSHAFLTDREIQEAAYRLLKASSPCNVSI